MGKAMASSSALVCKDCVPPNAAAAANAPIIVTRIAPQKAFIPVILLLKYPKINKQISVTIADTFKASIELLIKKYGDKGKLIVEINLAE